MDRQPGRIGGAQARPGNEPGHLADGRWVAYTVDTSNQIGLFVIPTSGGTPKVVFSDSGSTTPEYEYSYDWSSDSSKLAFGVSGDAHLVATFDVNTAQRGKSISFVEPADVAFVPGTEQVLALIGAGGEYGGIALLSINSLDGAVRQLVEIKDAFTSEIVASPTAVAAQTFTYSSVTLPAFLFTLQTLPVFSIDLASGARHSLGAGMTPVGWLADGHTLAGFAATCKKSACSFNAATINDLTGAKQVGAGLGAFSAKRIRLPRRHRHGKRRHGYAVRNNAMFPTAVAGDGASLLVEKYNVHARGRYALGRLYDDERAVYTIMSVPFSGAPPQTIGSGSLPRLEPVATATIRPWPATAPRSASGIAIPTGRWRCCAPKRRAARSTPRTWRCWPGWC